MRIARAAAAFAAAVTVTAGVAACGAGDDSPPTPGVGPGTYGVVCPRLSVEGADFPDTAAELIDRAADGEDPLLATMALALRTTGLRELLADPAGDYTVFVPVDEAFGDLPLGTVQRWSARPQEDLAPVLRHHIVPRRYDAEALAAQRAVTTLDGGTLVVDGAPGGLVVDDEQQAGVLCGNITTTNATVFVLDEVMLPDGPG